MTALSTVLDGPRELPLLTWASGMGKLAKRTTPTDPVARRIWEAMTVRGFSQRHVERTAGFVPGYMTRVLDGERNFTLQTLQAITQTLRVNVDWLVTGKGPRDIGTEGGGDPYERVLTVAHRLFGPSHKVTTAFANPSFAEGVEAEAIEKMTEEEQELHHLSRLMRIYANRDMLPDAAPTLALRPGEKVDKAPARRKK